MSVAARVGCRDQVGWRRRLLPATEALAEQWASTVGRRHRQQANNLRRYPPHSEVARSTTDDSRHLCSFQLVRVSICSGPPIWASLAPYTRAVISNAIAKSAPHLITWAHARSSLHFVFAFNVSVSANFITLRTRYVTILLTRPNDDLFWFLCPKHVNIKQGDKWISKIALMNVANDINIWILFLSGRYFTKRW